MAPKPRDPDRYHMLGEHGRGGLGRVSRVHDVELGRDIAIKELISRGHVSEMRFLREALITARLEHPGIVPVYEAGRWPDGTPFYAMKLVAGRSLHELIAERPTVDERIGLLHHVIVVADAIAYAHGRNIIHRDLKPANVIVGDFGETVVIDWGLAKDITATDQSTVGGEPIRAAHHDGLTSAGSILGTPAYMSPEQERGEPVDQRADVFAIGAMLWELCALQQLPPHYTGQRQRILRRAGIDQDLITIIVKAVDPDPVRRYPDAGALAADLKAFKTGTRISARRYSLLGMLTHWIRRHRALAASVTTVIAIAVATAALYVRNIALQRNRADAALESAERQKRRAVIASATALLERDPTQAWSAIASLGAATPETMVLRARIKAAGVADASLPLATRYDRIALTPSRTRLLISTVDRTLSMLDLRTLIMHPLADGMTEPAIFATTDTYVYAVRKAERLMLTRISIASGLQEDMVALTQLPDDLMASEAGVFWQTPDGSVYQLLPGHSARVVASEVAQFSRAGSKLAICDKRHTLRITDPGGVGVPLGSCMETWDWGERDGNFSVPIDDHRLAVYRDGTLRLVPFATGHGSPHLTLSNTGLIAAVDAEGNGAYLPPNAVVFRHVRLGQQPIETATEGSLIAWAFPDGGVKVLDSATGQEWSIKAHPQGTFCIYFLPPGNRLLTCGRNEFRLWTLPQDAPALVAELPAPAFNIAKGADGSQLLDGADGEVHLISHDSSHVVSLHKHSLLSFGVAWCDARACSASWDGRILCSSPEAKSTETVAAFGAPIRWLGSGSGHCFAAVSDGGIYDIRSPSAAVYRHHQEPYRLAVSQDGTRVASSDWGGTVKVWDLAGQRLVADLEHLDKGLITAVAWMDDGGLVTASFDGFVRTVSPDFANIRSWQLGAPVRYMSTSRDSIYAATTDGTIWDVSLRTGIEHRISLGTSLTAFATTPSQGYLAVGSDDGELFIVDDKHHVTAKRLERDIVGCAAFEDAHTLLFCGPGGRILRLELGLQQFGSEL